MLLCKSFSDSSVSPLCPVTYPCFKSQAQSSCTQGIFASPRQQGGPEEVKPSTLPCTTFLEVAPEVLRDNMIWEAATTVCSKRISLGDQGDRPCFPETDMRLSVTRRSRTEAEPWTSMSLQDHSTS